MDLVIEDGQPVAIPANNSTEDIFAIFSGPPNELGEIRSEEESSNEDVCLIS